VENHSVAKTFVVVGNHSVVDAVAVVVVSVDVHLTYALTL